MTKPLPGKLASARELLEKVYGDRPRSAMIEIADRCNETCVHCYQIQGQKGEMSTAEIRRILDDLAASGVLTVTFSGGEATLRSDLLELIAYARSLGFVVDLFTNGLRMTRDMARSLAELSVRTVEISLYSMVAERHDWVTQVPGSFDKTVAGIRHLVELGVAVKVKKPEMNHTTAEGLEFDRWVESLGAFPNVSADFKPREGGDRAPEALLSPEATRANAESRATPSVDPEHRADQGVCGACAGVHVEANGDLRPCPILEVSVGDARQGDIVRQVTQSPNGAFLREVSWKDLPGCSVCELNGFCSRCHAQALAQVGDALRPYPGACSLAVMRWEIVTGREACLPSSSIGPFAEKDGELEQVGYELTEEQAATYGRLEWLRGEASPHPGPTMPASGLVQLRRPGKPSKTEQLPE